MFILPEFAEDIGDNPNDIYQRLVATAEEFVELREFNPAINILFRKDEKLKGGKRVLASVHIPSVQGELRPLFEWMLEDRFGWMPAFLMIIELDWWKVATSIEREALVFHEMCHMRVKVDQFGAPRLSRETGEPQWTCIAHDIEEFNAVVARYGAWKCDVADFLAAARPKDRD